MSQSQSTKNNTANAADDGRSENLRVVVAAKALAEVLDWRSASPAQEKRSLLSRQQLVGGLILFCTKDILFTASGSDFAMIFAMNDCQVHLNRA